MLTGANHPSLSLMLDFISDLSTVTEAFGGAFTVGEISILDTKLRDSIKSINALLDFTLSVITGRVFVKVVLRQIAERVGSAVAHSLK